MNAVLYLNLLEILGEDQLKMLNFKITMCRNAVNTMLINIKIGKDSLTGFSTKVRNAF